MHAPFRSSTAVLAVVLLAAAGLAPPAASQVPAEVVEAYGITNESVEPPTRFEAFDATAVAVFDLDGDGVMEIIAANDNNRHYIFDGGTGSLVAEIQTRIPRPWDARELAGIAVGDVNGNKVPDLVIANSAGYITAFEARAPAEPTSKLELTKLWEYFIDPLKLDPHYFENRTALEGNYTGYVGLDGSVFLADVTGDGKDEVFFQTDDYPGHYALNSDGTLRWWIDWGDGNASPVVDDLDGDGRLEVVFVTDGGRVFVVDASSGKSRCTFHSREYGARPGSISVSARLVDLTGDGRKEIVFGTRQAVEDRGDPEWMKKQHAHYFALRSSCSVLWHKSYDFGNPLVYMRAGPVDIDGDGKLDLVFQDWNTIGHKPGNWEVTGKSNVFAVKGTTGEVLWRTAVDTYWSNKDIAIADVMGDSAPEILVVAPRAGEDGITLLDLAGKIRGFIGIGADWSVSRGPTVADLDGGGTMDIMVPIYRPAEGCPRQNLDVGCREGALKVFRTEKTTEPVWDGVFLFSRAYDYQGKERRAPVPTVEVSAPRATPGNLAIQVEGDVEATNVFVKRVGTTEWVGIPPVGENRFEAAMQDPPRANETFFVRVTLDGIRVAYASLNWHGQGDGRLEGYVTQTTGRPIGGALVELRQGDRVVANVTTGDDGAFRLDAPPGDYTLVASASGREERRQPVTIAPGELSRTAVRLEPTSGVELAVVGPAVIAVVAALGVTGVGVALVRRRRVR